MTLALKGVSVTLLAIAAWLTASLGQTWWALVALLVVDAILNWSDEARWLEKLVMVALTTAASVYLQGATGIAMAHLIVAAMAAFELTRVVTQITVLVKAAQTAGRITGPEADAFEGAMAILAHRVTALEGASGPVPGSLRDTAAKVAAK